MPDEIKPDASQAPTHDAQLAAENMVSGEEKTPKVDFEADYQAAQKMSVSDIDRTGEGAKAAAEATAPEHELRSSGETNTVAKETGNPDDYIDMAKDVNSSKTEAVTEVSDDLVKQALEKGQSK
ncbi:MULTISPECIES: hypothetical protein [Nostocales]|uniref:Uncharacterized protein n=3 Tax=Nostocales TaxID=1161 RepID=A0A0C1RDJ6_9CYAN|nr:hypothetical protein [Tolypothrix bouteillei]KAF3886273.1 hypothetical protein DA73_0400012895 [Tolypothrix bouteillei VB521301]